VGCLGSYAFAFTSSFPLSELLKHEKHLLKNDCFFSAFGSSPRELGIFGCALFTLGGVV